MSTGADRLMLGSFYQPNRWDHDLSISAPYIQSMLRRCKEICPRLNILKDSDIQVTVGIRLQGNINIDLNKTLMTHVFFITMVITDGE